jgi:hypothetical protein
MSAISAAPAMPSYVSRLFSPENLPNIALALVGMGGIVVAVLTLLVIKRQTQALVDAERARVFVSASRCEGREAGEAMFTLRATNYGKMPARITMYTYAEAALKNPEKELRLPPQYGESLLRSEKILAFGDALEIAVFDPFSEANKQKWQDDAKFRAVIFGRVQYLDGHSDEKRETRFAYRHVRSRMPEIGGNVTRCGPPEYNRSDLRIRRDVL